ncbi:2-hydroxychromene-2-carboxylate isomerase [Halieaceae bacterium IMCC14734]|uniref:2-hydroxychromene-2-carboxylate isomerase n=1 Tax=Candidatus Litorirhabdus singularis TaxID=2518993 RepID=A0ABT3TI52_9GAMM|nr:DsbA family protein [Candidatus Litorirhabdus singularis]MCX2982000.1 2-hydroxychromene-2-carboxylate isomerase [Candidatus Litorirhabdus singularis]
MAPKFEDQGGIASSNPSGLVRWIGSRVTTHVASQKRRQNLWRRAEKQRVKNDEPHQVHYYHQVDDPYSYLAAQLLDAICANYKIELQVHLVAGPSGDNSPEPILLQKYSCYDCAAVAPHYGLKFPSKADMPSARNVDVASRLLAGMSQPQRRELLPLVCDALWENSSARLEQLAQRYKACDQAEALEVIGQGTALQTQQGHYSGAMFYYAGEWYWGVDRLYHLEERLSGLGLRRGDGRKLVAPRPKIDLGPRCDSGSMTLEFYPSLRSPYTSIIFDRTLALAEASGVRLVLRPVLPMVMRGVSLSRTKGLYIIADAAREAHALGIEWGKIFDPIGTPVKRAYALFPWAQTNNKGAELLSSFLHAAWFEGVNTGSDRGLRKVVERAGLDWKEAQAHLADTDWQEQFESSRQTMYQSNIWGVPAYRLLDGDGKELLVSWGQDRLWLVARVIQEQLRSALEQHERLVP